MDIFKQGCDVMRNLFFETTAENGFKVAVAETQVKDKRARIRKKAVK